jgi:protein-tyrosine phosphatase
MDATEIVPGLWIGNRQSSENLNFLQKNNIFRIVNCAKEVKNSFPKIIMYYNIPLEDSSNDKENTIFFNHIHGLLHFCLDNGYSRKNAILCNCAQGISRSASAVVAVLRANRFNSLKDAINMILSKRPKCFFFGKYFNFRNALIKYFQY